MAKAIIRCPYTGHFVFLGTDSPGRSAIRSRSGGKRTSRKHAEIDAIVPTRTSAREQRTRCTLAGIMDYSVVSACR
jgi:hypothetical protein